jgi:hypothetical protein
VSADPRELSDGSMSCPVPHPDADPDKPCVKKIPAGWTADEGHAGGHMWMSAETAAILDSGHYDSIAAVSGLPFSAHDPDDCSPPCPRFYDRKATP